MKIIYNNILPFKGFAAINLFGILFVRKGVAVTDRMLNHEKIHTAQMVEMLFVFFYLWYIVEWVVRLFIRRNSKGMNPLVNSYYNIGFEREAYQNERNLNYLKERKKFAWIKYI
jgi:hypothetical protein